MGLKVKKSLCGMNEVTVVSEELMLWANFRLAKLHYYFGTEALV